jgi:predicted glycosyltransferase
MSRPRLFFYVQHLLGIGHLVRANRIAAALHQRGFDVMLASGGMPVPNFPGPGPTLLQLPPVKAGQEGFSELEDSTGKRIDEQFRESRRRSLLEGFHSFAPDVVVLEAFPFGRRAMRFELLPLLEAANGLRKRPLIACSIRDILQDSHKPGRAEETVNTLNRYFDLVLVHGDPRFAELRTTFGLAHAITCDVVHTGLVSGGMPQPAAERYDVVVSAGGGAAAAGLLATTLALVRRSNRGLRWCIVTGPNATPALPDERAIPEVDIFRFRSDLPSLLLNAQLSISQAGYNTVCDVLRAGCRVLLVPFAAGGETEQTARAERLRQMKLADWIAEDELTLAQLSAAVDRSLVEPPPPPHGLDLEGAQHTADLLWRHADRAARAV